MKDLINHNGRKAVLYAGLLGFSALINNQIILMDSIKNALTSFEQGLKTRIGSGFLVSLGEFILGIILLSILGKLIKIAKKKKQMQKYLIPKPTETEEPAPTGPSLLLIIAPIVSVILALAGTACLFASTYFFSNIYGLCTAIITKNIYDPNTQAPGIAVLIKVTIGLLGIFLFIVLYKWRIARRHGPTFRRLNVDGQAWLTERISWKNLVIGRKIKFIPFIGKAGIHLPDWATNTDSNERISVEVDARDFPSGDDKDITFISYNLDREPGRLTDPESASLKRFERNLLVADGKSKTLVRRAMLIENDKRTRAKSIKAYGENFAKEGRCLFCLKFNIKRGMSDDTDEDQDAIDHDDLDSGIAANSFERWDKLGLRRILDWGPGYKLIYRSRAFDIDMDFFGTIPLGKGRALRRKFYVKDANNRIVAKMTERHILKKIWPIMDNDWQIDIFNPDLANDESFGYILSLITQYFRNTTRYENNACQRNIEQKETSTLEPPADD
ncbi:MAG: hypothetical protein K9M57_09870 [Phycisphaerae bacterium]|nr:hypothetical protein [Phycisphaerae bacterium]